MGTHLNYAFVPKCLPTRPKLTHEIIDLSDTFDGAHDLVQKLYIGRDAGVEDIVGALKAACERK